MGSCAGILRQPAQGVTSMSVVERLENHLRIREEVPDFNTVVRWQVPVRQVPLAKHEVVETDSQGRFAA